MAVRPKTQLMLGDPSQWVDRYGDRMLQFAYARLGSLEEAEDAVQEAMLAAWRGRNSFDGRSTLGTWLIGILRRKIADHHRRNARRAESTGAGSTELEAALFAPQGHWVSSPRPWRQSPDGIAETAEFWSVLDRCLEGLPPHLSQAFHMREISRSAVDEICRLIDITPKNLAVRLFRARALLRRCLERTWSATEGKK
jgi:RNA polymerase sigma-70 factor (ECF subfamily)